MVYETEFSVPSNDVHMAHRIVYAMGQRWELPLQHCWGFTDDCVVTLRTSTPITKISREVIIPEKNTCIDFEIKVQFRKTKTFHGKKLRVPNNDYFASMAWMEQHASNMGLNVQDDDFTCDFVDIAIHKPNRWFITKIPHFHGKATIIDTSAFEQGLLHNIANGKTYGWGFLIYNRRTTND